MKIEHILTIALCISSALRADDIRTLDGAEFKDVKNLSIQPDCLKFYTEDGPKTVDFLALDDQTRQKYSYDPLLAGIARGMTSRPGSLKKSDGFSLNSVEQIIEKAKAENKLVGFMMMWDQFYNKPASPMGKGSESGALHFFNSFKDSMLIVFVAHENELDKVPDSVKKGFFGPDEGGFAPNMCVVSSDLKDFIVEIPLGGANSDGKVRQGVFDAKMAAIKQYLADNNGTCKK